MDMNDIRKQTLKYIQDAYGKLKFYNYGGVAESEFHGNDLNYHAAFVNQDIFEVDICVDKSPEEMLAIDLCSLFNGFQHTFLYSNNGSSVLFHGDGEVYSRVTCAAGFLEQYAFIVESSETINTCNISSDEDREEETICFKIHILKCADNGAAKKKSLDFAGAFVEIMTYAVTNEFDDAYEEALDLL